MVQEGWRCGAVDEPLVELETDKVTIEVPAPAAGVLTDVAVKDGETVAVGALLVRSRKAPSSAGESAAASGGGRAAAGCSCASSAAPAAAKPVVPKAPAADVPPAPSVRKIAAETGMDAASVAGTGKDGGLPRRYAGGDRARRSRPTPSRHPPPPSRCARRRRPTMPHARSACG